MWTETRWFHDARSDRVEGWGGGGDGEAAAVGAKRLGRL